MAIAIALELLGSVAVLLVSTQQIVRFFHLVDAVFHRARLRAA
ncbi:MAG: hypothetical protein WA580_06285 [Acidimicrobiales bacterium]